MKKSQVFLIAAIVFLAAGEARLFADETVDLLMAGPWKVCGMTWTRTRVFYENGSFTSPGDESGHGTWRLHDGIVELEFADKHKDAIILPLNPKGTLGTDSHHYPSVAYLQGPAPAQPAESKPQASPGSPPTLLSPDDSIAILTAGPWKMWGNDWSGQYSFRKNGTFFSDSGGDRGKWQITGDEIELQFDDGHKDKLALPLKPRGSPGIAADGLTMVAYLINYEDVKGMLPGAVKPETAMASGAGQSPAKTPAPAPPTAGHASPAPSAAAALATATPFVPSRPLPADTVGLLTAGPWKMQGMTWALTCSFNRDGTIDRGSHANKDGTWRIEGNLVVINFASEPIILSLPLDPRGTIGSRNNVGGIAILTTAPGQPNIAAGGALTAPPPGPAPAAMPEADTIALLTAGTWRFWSLDWEVDHTFRSDGTFTTNSSKIGPGTWKLGVGTIELDFQKGGKQTILLPLDPKGSFGRCSDGFAMMGFLFGAPPHLSAPLPATHRWPTPPPSVAASRPTPPPGQTGAGLFPLAVAIRGGAEPVAQSSPISPEMQQKAADLVKAYHSSLVFVNGKEGAGSGFIAAIDGKNFLVTNAHVAAGIRDATFKDVDDTTVKGGAAFVAVGRDLYTMAMPPGGNPLQVMDKVGENAAIGDEVVVLGNAEGQGVVNLITGRITGIGGDRVEVDAPFVPGNSGSPIIHIKTGKVIGVATYAFIKDYDATTQTPTFRPVVRRFGYRIDNVKQWEAVNPGAFAAQAAEMEGIQALTQDLLDVCEAFAGGMGRLDPEEFTSPAVKNSVEQWVKATSGRHTGEERKQAVVDLFSALRNIAGADVAAARQHMTYDYFKGELAGEQEYRDALVKVFDEAVKRAGD